MMFQNCKINDHALRLRAEWANSLVYALTECHPEDAAAICVAFLETVETDGPIIGDPFGVTVSDARLWAVAAPPHELTAYTLAGLEVLPEAHLSIRARKRCFNALWRSFTTADQARFISAVSKRGQP